MRVYYFTPSQFALSNIALRRLKISRLSQLNDPFELLAVNLKSPSHRQFFRRVKERLDQDNGVLCFSRAWHNPLLWGHYADKHTGIALGFDINSELLEPVIYSKRPLKIDIDTVLNMPILNDEVVNKLARTKFYDWKYEDEMRAYVKLDHSTRESGFYFYPFDASVALKEVILGPRCELPIKSIESLLETYPHPVKVFQSRIAFQSFRVIEKN